MINLTVAERLSRLPRKIASMRGNDILPDCILYELIKDSCFNCSYAAYFMYNPDFHLCKGISGIDRQETEEWQNDVWENFNDFSAHIKKTSFRKKILETNFCTIDACTIDGVVKAIKTCIDNTFTHHHTWKIHNDNHAIFLYTPCEQEVIDESYIADGAALLSLCFF